jgi:hypothetical protein
MWNAGEIHCHFSNHWLKTLIERFLEIVTLPPRLGHVMISEDLSAGGGEKPESDIWEPVRLCQITAGVPEILRKRPQSFRDEILNLQRWWRKKYISAAMISKANRKRKMPQLLLVSGVIGELAIAALLKSGLVVFASTNFKSSILVSSS